MFGRLIKLSKNNSLFVFGARGTGKTTLIEKKFSGANTLWIDLLKDKDEEKFRKDPDMLSKILAEHSYQRIVIDEIQKIPKLLDIVHH
ncbi:MAG: hypothetical protein A3B70_01680 [Deltaproteobacteria bacterium RIFCSPHIGHO2_02_FULL_40_11]|nr:MAG: hypothetical protein A3B70_01680 [Deltaproteobacteria bacterium RIFCSPHIGHO2_02_FULL_40_11]